MSNNKSGIWRSKSMVTRLLVPVNVITFVVVTAMSALAIYEQTRSTEISMLTKADSTVDFLQSVGQTYVANYDLTALDGFTKIARNDPDVAFAVYFDKDGHAITDSSKMVARENVFQIEKPITDLSKKEIGKVVVGYKKDRVQSAFYHALWMGIFSVLGVQLLLSAGIFFVIRGILKPFQDSLGRLSRSTTVLSKTSDEVSKFSASIAVGVSQQAEVVQETTAAMSEMSSMLNQAAEYTKQSESLMDGMTLKANNGMNVMKRLVDSMTSVQQANEQLKQMVQIIREITNKTNVINDIVFKTQLLSFNASIEAARAGQHGRGFAVVAEEVGNLAKTSGVAAQDIGALLQDSERQVNEIVKNTDERVRAGQQVTEQAMKNFEEIAGDIETISTNIANISSAAREQGLGVAQTTQAMGELSKTTDLNSQVAHGSSQTAQLLKSEVDSLRMIAITIQTLLMGKEDAHTKYVSTMLSAQNLGIEESRADKAAEAVEAANNVNEAGDIDDIVNKITHMAELKRQKKPGEPAVESVTTDEMKKTG